MSAAVVMAPSAALHERSNLNHPESPLSNGAHVTATASIDVSPSAPRNAAISYSSNSATTSSSNSAAPPQRSDSHSPRTTDVATGKSSPLGASRPAGRPPKIMVKKEPKSPDPAHSRPRPRRLDLSKNTINNSNNPPSARPMTARDGLVIQEVGLACLSPGFVTQDPVMKEQLQRSLSVREQQRNIIEARLHQQSAKGDGSGDKEPQLDFTARTPGMSRRNRAPPGLSIVAPSHEQFANERVIQSAPLGHSFTGRQHPAPLSRHFANQPSNLSGTSHIHHVPANQTNNRLPPISDVFSQTLSAHPDNAPQSYYPSAASSRGPPTSPGHPSSCYPPPSARSREYKSAEEAQQELAGGRPELLPKLVHYGGHQPPTPPSPAPGSRVTDGSRSTSKRRPRAEYEDGGSPPLGHGPTPTRRGPFGAGRDSPESQRQKREEFLRLCERAWDLFHC